MSAGEGRGRLGDDGWSLVNGASRISSLCLYFAAPTPTATASQIESQLVAYIAA
jgi:hypothetical protein